MKTNTELAEKISALVDQYSGADVLHALGEEFVRRFWIAIGKEILEMATLLESHPEYPESERDTITT